MPKKLKVKQVEAQERDKARASRTNEEQIALLKTRRGNSAREIARLS